MIIEPVRRGRRVFASWSRAGSVVSKDLDLFSSKNFRLKVGKEKVMSEEAEKSRGLDVRDVHLSFEMSSYLIVRRPDYNDRLLKSSINMIHILLY